MPIAIAYPKGSHDVPIAIAYPKGSPGALVAFCQQFVGEMKASGFAQQAIDRMGKLADGVVVAVQ